MIRYAEIKTGDVVKVVGLGAPGFVKNGEFLTVIETGEDYVRCEAANGGIARFNSICGAERLSKINK